MIVETSFKDAEGKLLLAEREAPCRTAQSSTLLAYTPTISDSLFTSFLDIGIVCCIRLLLARVSRRAGLLFAGLPAPRNRVNNPANDSLSQFERDAVSWETHVCSQLAKLTDDRGTHAEKKGPLLDVDLDRSEEDRQSLANPGNEPLVDVANTASALVHREIASTY